MQHPLVLAQQRKPTCPPKAAVDALPDPPAAPAAPKLRHHGHAVPVKPVGGLLAERLSSSARPPTALQPGTYWINDPSIFWLKGRPYRFHKVVGEGGFGQVCQVEMLIPRGTMLSRTDTGGFVLDRDGVAELRVAGEVLCLVTRDRADQHPTHFLQLF